MSIPTWISEIEARVERATAIPSSYTSVWSQVTDLQDVARNVPRLIEALKVAVETLEFYAGGTNDALWEGNRFISIDKFGLVNKEASGSLVAREALRIIQTEPGEEK